MWKVPKPFNIKYFTFAPALEENNYYIFGSKTIKCYYIVVSFAFKAIVGNLFHWLIRQYSVEYIC